MISIIVPYLDAFEYTQECVKAIQECSSGYEIILVDNGSSLEIDWGNIKTVRNDKNLGFPKAINQGIGLAQGEYICVLNNDVLVTPQWDQRLLWHLGNGADIVGPRTNIIDGPQICLVNVYYNKEGLYEASEKRYQDHIHNSWPFARLVGFCLMFRREVIDKIGNFDEAFGIGNFEDDDFSMRAIEAGYKLRIANDVYVHHFGSMTHKLLDLDYKALINRNRKIFDSKWPNDKVEELYKKNEN